MLDKDKAELKGGGFLKEISSFFASIRLSLILLSLLALASMLGTFIPQQFKGPLPPGLKARIFSFFSLYDVYHSWWFQILLFLLAVNMIVCTFKRLPAVWRIVKSDTHLPSVEAIKKSSNLRSFHLKEDLDLAGEKAEGVLSGLFSKSRKKLLGEDLLIVYRDSGAWSRLGVYLVHFSVLLLLAGGLLGSIYGFSGFANIAENETTHEIKLRSGDKTKDLGFSIKCEEFFVDFYKDGTPSEYRSSLVLLGKEGEEILKQDIKVNHPLVYKGLRFYQSSYGVASAKNIVVKLISEDGKTQAVNLEIRESCELPYELGHLLIMNFIDNFHIKGHRLGPSFLGFYENPEGKREIVVLPQRHPGFDRMRMGERGFALELESFDPIYYTGLQISRDPGVFLVYSGFIFMIIGCFTAFFFSHKKIFVLIEREKDGVHYFISARTNRNPVTLSTKLDSLASALGGGSSLNKRSGNTYE